MQVRGERRTQIVGYQIGYRICQIEHSDPWCSCSYTDLPMHVVDGIDTYAPPQFEAAQALLDTLRKNFWAAEAEWRIVECWE
jgi:hypothetical protein